MFWEEMGLSVCLVLLQPGEFSSCAGGFDALCKAQKAIPASLPVLACAHQGSRPDICILEAVWAGAEGGEICPHGLSLPALISWVQIKSFSHSVAGIEWGRSRTCLALGAAGTAKQSPR